MNTRLKYAAYVVLVVFLLVIVVDVALHYTPLRGYAKGSVLPQDYIRSKPGSDFDIVPEYATSTVYLPDRSQAIWSNEYACFDMPFISGTSPYIYVTGDSFAWGFAPFESKWGTLLEQYLAMRVAKCGILGYGTNQELQKASENIEQMGTPKLIVVSFYQNDIGDDTWFLAPEYKNLRNANLARYQCFSQNIANDALCWLWYHSIFFNILFSTQYNSPLGTLVPKAFSSVYGYAGDVLPVEGRPEVFTKEGILGFKSFAASVDSKLLFVMVPSKHSIAKGGTTLPVNDAIREFLEENQIEYIDLYPTFTQVSSGAGDRLYWAHDSHFNIEGNKLTGLLVAEYVLRHHLVPDPDMVRHLAEVQQQLAQEFQLPEK